MYDKQAQRKEGLKPVSNTPPDTFINNLKFQARLLLDFQTNTVYRHLQEYLPKMKGKVVDIGCGQSPYKHLLNSYKTQYYGLDIEDAAKNFDYDNSQIIHFDGQHIPLADSSMDCFVCTEVLEHVKEPEKFIAEIYRVLKIGGLGIVTVPWSARYHYIPYDYYRFTPSALTILFQDFSSIKVISRGTDITVIVSKIIVAYFRGLSSPKRILLWLLKIILSLAIFPFLILCIVIGHISLALSLGSKDDPLGYTIWLHK
ncbi:class I SAM-dependent methyltransferase [Nostoc sp. PA-18-2419]|uniref:class I SAM-dependent methyltransferase n=1 Tax=Nostoc sp. PA-18-2419 TaxID=2575443 RepID=UPI00110818F6|nr:class I SAM-dependent methyltransferase [Nostoc sp. PA-18-2419]